jgi:hypothetical protein
MVDDAVGVLADSARVTDDDDDDDVESKMLQFCSRVCGTSASDVWVSI